MRERRNPDDLFDQAVTLYQQGDADAALATIDRVLELEPEVANAWGFRGSLLSQMGRKKEALDSYERLLEVDSKSASGWYSLGCVLQDLGRLDDAVRAFSNATLFDPKRADAWINQGRLLDDSGKHAEALVCYDQAAPNAPEEPVLWANRGNSLRSLGRHAEAESSYDRALRLNRQEAGALLGKALIAQEAGRFAAALPLLDRFLTVTDAAVGWVNKGYCLASLGRLAESLPCFERAVEREPRNAVAWSNLGESNFKLRRLAPALAAFDRALGVDPRLGSALYGKARTLTGLARPAEAAAVALTFLNVVPTEDERVPTARVMAEGSPRSGSESSVEEEGVEAVRDSAAIPDPEDFALGLVGRVQTYAQAMQFYDAGDYAGAIPWFDQLLTPDQDPGFASAILAAKGSCLTHLKRYAESMEALDRAVSLDPKCEPGWYNRGQCLRTMGRYEQAIESYDRALALAPRDSQDPDEAASVRRDAWHRKGLCLEALGRKNEAKECFRKSEQEIALRKSESIVLALIGAAVVLGAFVFLPFKFALLVLVPIVAFVAWATRSGGKKEG